MISKKMLVLGIALVIFANKEIIASPIESSSQTYVPNFTGFTNNMIYIQSYNNNKVINSTDKAVHITACYGLAVNNCGRTQEKCFKVTVNPHSTWEDSWSPVKTCFFRYAGNYAVRSYAIIEGDTKSFQDAFATVIVR